MSKTSDALEERLDQLRTLRDELRVRAHLGKAEVKERWEKAERSWQHLEAKLELLRDESRESLAEVRSAAGLLVEEIRDAYRHIRDAL